jgi:hypothetical protein
LNGGAFGAAVFFWPPAGSHKVCGTDFSQHNQAKCCKFGTTGSALLSDVQVKLEYPNA